MPDMPEGGGGIGEYLKNPWVLGGIAAAGGVYYFWRKNQLNSAASSNTTSAYGNPTVGEGVIQPIIIGGQQQQQQTTVGTPTPAGTPLTTTGLSEVSNPSLAKQLVGKGFNLYSYGQHEYYDPNQIIQPGHPGQTYLEVSNPQQAKQLASRGYSLVSVGPHQYYNPSQSISKAPAKKVSK